jgi:aminopeptidase N
MRTEQPKTIYLKDYQEPYYWIDETHLTFELFEDHALVHSRLSMRRNQDLTSDSLPALVLDGQLLELVSVALDEQPLQVSDYQLDEDTLTLTPATAEFVVSVTTRIEPQHNTALEGLYQSGKMFCTQCEAEGFRKITYYLDRPDVMSRFTTTVIASRDYPILLSNGNPVANGEEKDGRHWVTWEDPFPKPAYLFALGAGDLCLIQDSFTTVSGREIDLRIYVEPENREQCGHAMDSLKRSMR